MGDAGYGYADFAEQCDSVMVYFCNIFGYL